MFTYFVCLCLYVFVCQRACVRVYIGNEIVLSVAIKKEKKYIDIITERKKNHLPTFFDSDSFDVNGTSSGFYTGVLGKILFLYIKKGMKNKREGYTEEKETVNHE